MGAPTTASVPERIGGYVVGATIGTGGFGEVFQARHPVIDREVAIKVLHAHRGDAEAVERFAAEARVVNRISHPGIVETFDFGELEDGRHYYVMELIRGRNLRAVLRDRGKLPLAEALPVLRGIAEVVDAAHAAGVAHRDLKPENIFVVADAPGVKLIDFGLAKLVDDRSGRVTETGTALGTPRYMSPEQCRGKQIGLTTDHYAFGVIAYELLSGTTPFDGDALNLALAHLNEPPPPLGSREPGIPAHVGAAIARLLAKDPDERPRTLCIAVDAMEHAPRRRSRLVVAVPALAITTAVAVLVAALRPDDPAYAYRRADRTLPPHPSLAWFTLTPDGSGLVLVDRQSRGRLDLASGVLDRLPGTDESLVRTQDQASYTAVLPDGSHLVTACLQTCQVYVEDARSEHRRVIIASTNSDGASAEPSPDGTQFAIVRYGYLEVVSLADGEARRIAEVSRHRISGLRWSPDGRYVVWASMDPEAATRLHVTAIETGEIRGVEAGLLGLSTSYATVPADFVDPTHLAYCTMGDEGVEVRVRSIAGGHETTVASLPRDTSDCAISAKGDRIAVAYSRSSSRVGVLDGRTPRALSDDSLVLHEVVGDRAYAYRATRVSPSRWLSTTPPGASLVEVAANGSVTEISSCPSDADVVRRGATLLHVDIRSERADAVVRLRSHGDCSTVEEWRLPLAGRWTRPRCGATACAIAGLMEDRLSVWRLQPGGIAIPLSSGDPRSAFGVPMIAISEDGRRVVASSGPRGRLNLATDDKLPPTPMSSTPLSAPSRQGVAWVDETHFVYAGYGAEFVPGSTNVIVQASLDSETEVRWASPDDAMYDLVAARGKIYGTLDLARDPELIVLDRER